jgi:hypothetical protein
MIRVGWVGFYNLNKSREEAKGLDAISFTKLPLLLSAKPDKCAVLY